MRQCFFAAAVLLASSAVAFAADVQLTINNASTRAITGLTMAAKANGQSTANLLPALAAGAKSSITIAGGDPTCVYAITVTFATGTPTTIPDVDICQTTSIKVE